MCLKIQNKIKRKRNEFNPDVVHSFENEDKSRTDTKYELKNR